MRLVLPIADEVRAFLKEEGAENLLKKHPESLMEKNLADYDIIVAMEPIHRDYILSLCPQCKDKIVVWNIPDPYLMNKRAMWKIFQKIKAKVTELANLSP